MKGELILKNNVERKHYIDNLRWTCILLLIPFHTAMSWNCWGEGNYIYFYKSRVLSSFIVAISPWYMALLFVLAGISARLSIQKKGYQNFVRERISKLLIPLIAGVSTVVALMTYYSDRFHHNYQGSFLSHYQVFFTRFTDLTGYDGGWTPGHLWFLLYLFLISIIGLGVIALQRKYFIGINFENMNAVGVVFLILLLPPASKILDISGKSIGFYLILYLIGYYILAEDKVLDQVVTYRYRYMIVMLIANILDVYLFIWTKNSNSILNTIAMFITCWFGILTILGFGKTVFNYSNIITKYLTSRSFFIYIFHFIYVIMFQFYFHRVIENIIIFVIVTISGSLVMTLITCEIIRRIPVIRVLFGYKKLS